MNEQASLEAAFATSDPLFTELGYAWELVRRGAEAYIRDFAELDQLIAHLDQDYVDYVLEELGFASLGDGFRVSLLDEQEPSERSLLLPALKTVRRRAAEALQTGS
ncbi:MAG: hypothetical protein ACAI44_07455 [Candidatus Sericytochromatia bacterium]